MSNPVNTVRLRAATSVVAVGTLVSRLAGLAREVVIAALFGAGGATDAFFVAFRIPNTLRRLLAEGGVTVAVMPVYTDSLKAPPAERRRYERALFSSARLGLLAVTLVGVAAAPWLVPLFAAGFAVGDDARFAETVVLTRALFPFVYFIGLVGAAIGILNARGRFFVPAVGPVVFSLGVIAGALWVPPWLPDDWPPAAALAFGAFVGVAGHWWVLRAALRRDGVHTGWAWRPGDPKLRQTAKLLVPAVAGLGVYQLQVLVGTQFASFLSTGGVSALYYADRLMQLPLAVMGTAVGTVALPLLSRAQRDGEALGPRVGEVLAWVAFLIVPAAAGLVLVRHDLVALVYERGLFDAAAGGRTAAALAGYGVALVPAAMVRVLQPAFFAQKDMRTPVLAGGAGLLVQAAASAALFRFDVLGLALASAAASLTQVVVLLIRLGRGGARPSAGGRSLLATTAAAALMVVAVMWVGGLLAPGPMRLAAMVFAGGTVYGLAAIGLRHPEWRRVRARVRAVSED